MTKKELTDWMVAELKICKRLCRKFPKSKFNYRPAKGMRSATELLRYISFCGTECTRILLLDSFKTQNWGPYMAAEKKAKTLKPSQFPAAIDRQIGDLRRLIAKISDRDFTQRKIAMPMGPALPLNQAIAASAARFVSGYRMQLYLYAKASGAKKLGTADCWFKY